MKRFLFLSAVCVFSVWTLAGQAVLSIQGSIQNSSGAALPDGKYPLTFRLYESVSGGTAVWSETQPGVAVSGGLYSTTLGLVTPLTAAFDKPYFLGVSVRESPEITPRARLSAAPYSLSLVGQSNLLPSTGGVGIGTVAPASGSQLHVQKNNGTARVVVEGRDTARVVFKADSDSASLSFDGSRIHITNFNIVFEEGLNLAEGKTIAYDGDPDWRLVEYDDFESGTEGWIATTSWTSTTPAPFERMTPNTPFSKGYLLRPTAHGSHPLKKEFDLTGIPHSKVKVVFTYHFFDSWDYKALTQLEFAFAGFANQNAPQANGTNGAFQLGWRSPAPPGLRLSDHFVGAGYTTFAPWADHNVRGSMVAETSENKFWVIFGSNLSDNVSDEGYGISNIEIWVK